MRPICFLAPLSIALLIGCRKTAPDQKTDPAESSNVLKQKKNAGIIKELDKMILERMTAVKDPVLGQIKTASGKK